MKVLAFTDAHCDMASAEAIIALVREENPAVILCSGDVSYFGRGYERFLERLSVLGKIYWVPGNHDDGMADLICQEFPYMVDVSERPQDLCEFVIFGVPGSREFWPDKDFDDSSLNGILGKWSTVASGRKTVFLSHFPPRGCAIDGTAARSLDAGGSQLVREFVDMVHPALVISGHYHSEFGGRCKLGRSLIVNPGPNGTIYNTP